MTPTEQAADRVKALVEQLRIGAYDWGDDQLMDQAADALTALQARVGELEGALKPLLSCLDDIETYQRRPERGDWGVECAWPHKAEAVPTRTPQVSHEFREAKQNNPSPTTGADQ